MPKARAWERHYSFEVAGGNTYRRTMRDTCQRARLRVTAARAAAADSTQGYVKYEAEATSLRALILENADASGGTFDRMPLIDKHKITSAGQENIFTAVSTDGRGKKYFEKCVVATNQEALFWKEWPSRLMEPIGRFHRIIPPVAMAEHDGTALLIFPFIDGMVEEIMAVRRLFSRLATDVARAAGEFCALNSVPSTGLHARTPTAERQCVVPKRGVLAAALRVSDATADEMLADHRTIGRAWPRVVKRLSSLRKVLCHRDMVPSNIIFSPREVPAIIDFGRVS